MNKHLLKFALTPLLALVLLVGVPTASALEDEAAPGARAAALANQAAVLEADIDKACQKVARKARQLCRRQHAQAVERLRARAARVR